MKTKTMQIKDNKLYLGSFSLEELADKFGTPLYVYDEVHMRNKISRYVNNFKDNKYDCKIVYATKAFLAPYLVQILKEYGVYADAVSGGDLYLLEQSGYPMNMVVLHGNNKSIAELEMAIEKGVGYIVVDNVSELQDLIELTNKRKTLVKTLFRVNPGVEAHTHTFIQTSLLDSKFGESIFDLSTIDQIMMLYKNSQYVTLDGFHAHIGSQISDGKSFVKLVEVMAKFIKEVEDKYQMKMSTLDLGGGFGIKYLDDDKEINVEEAVKLILDAVHQEFNGLGLSIKNLMIEPGRSIVGDSGITIYRTHRIKHTYAGVEYAFIDGGMPDNIRPSLYQAKYTVINASRVEGEKNVYNIAGKCCESGDMIAKGVEITKPLCDDILCVFSTGAYCYSMSMNYNGLTRPGVIFVNEDKITEAIRKETYEELVKTCNFKF